MRIFSLPGRAHLAFLLAIFSMFMIIYSARVVPTVLGDPDTSWHVATGQLIRAEGGIPPHDPWSFTANGAPWYNLSWAYDVAVSLLYDWGGFDALAVTALLLGAAIMTWTAKRCLDEETSYPASFVALLFCGTLFSVGLTMRPHLVSFLLLLGFTTLLRWAEYDPLRQRKLVWQLPLLMLAWANIHGAFLTGFLAIGAYGLSALLEGRKETATRLLWITALCLLATLVNPMGPTLYYGAYRTLSGDLTALIREWRQPSTAPYELFTWFVLLFIGCFSLHRPKLRNSDRVQVFLWLLLAFSSRRYVLFAAVILCPVLAACIHYAAANNRWSALYRARVEEYRALFSRPLTFRVLRATALALVIVLVFPIVRPLIWQGGIDFRHSDIPVEQIEYATAHYPHANVLNAYNFGGYILLMAKGRLHPFIDGRAETAYPDALIRDYIRFHGFAEGWEKLPDRYKADLILVQSNLSQRYLLDRLEGWKLVSSGEHGTLYARKKALMGKSRTPAFPAR